LLDQEKEREEILLFEMVCWFHMQYTHFWSTLTVFCY
jgi:hypothetical protein